MSNTVNSSSTLKINKFWANYHLTRKQICFVQSVFGKLGQNKSLDRNRHKIPDVRAENLERYRFFYFTTKIKSKITSSGWKKVLLTNITFTRDVIQSRWPFFYNGSIQQWKTLSICYVFGRSILSNYTTETTDFWNASGKNKTSNYVLIQPPLPRAAVKLKNLNGSCPPRKIHNHMLMHPWNGFRVNRIVPWWWVVLGNCHYIAIITSYCSYLRNGDNTIHYAIIEER